MDNKIDQSVNESEFYSLADKEIFSLISKFNMSVKDVIAN